MPGLFHALISGPAVEGRCRHPGGPFTSPPPTWSSNQRGAGDWPDQMTIPKMWPSAVRSWGEREWGVACWRKPRRGETCPCGRIHGDPKINNMLMDVASGEAIALVDLRHSSNQAWCITHRRLSAHPAANPPGEGKQAIGPTVRFDPSCVTRSFRARGRRLAVFPHPHRLRPMLYGRDA